MVAYISPLAFDLTQPLNSVQGRTVGRSEKGFASKAEFAEEGTFLVHRFPSPRTFGNKKVVNRNTLYYCNHGPKPGVDYTPNCCKPGSDGSARNIT